MLFFQLLVVLLARALPGFSQSLLLGELLILRLLLHMLDGIESLDQGSYLTFFVSLKQLGDGLALGSADLFLFADFDLFDCFEG